MLVNEYKPEFYDRKVQKMRNLSNVKICGFPFVMSRTDAQNGLYSIFKQFFNVTVSKLKYLVNFWIVARHKSPWQMQGSTLLGLFYGLL